MNPNTVGNRGGTSLPGIPVPKSNNAVVISPSTTPALQGLSTSSPTATPSQVSNDPIYLARTIVINNYSDPWQMAEQFWLLKKQLLEGKHGIHFPN